MNKAYGDDAFVTPLQMAEEEQEAKLLDYLYKVGSGDLWIYTESHRIEDACGAAAALLKKKNREIASLKSKERKLALSLMRAMMGEEESEKPKKKASK